MNYFAHAIRFLSRDRFSIGTSLPDMLSVVDRKSRLRAKNVVRFVDGSASFSSEIAAGVLQHLEDDRWFHNTTGFHQTTAQLTAIFKQTIGGHDGMRCSFLGHITAELQLDGVLNLRFPGLLDEYYQRLEQVDAKAVAQEVDRMATKPVTGFEYLIEKFRQSQFMRDYTNPSRLLFRLNQVMKRVGLEQLPAETESALSQTWEIVAENAETLLPQEHFDWSQIG